MRYLILESKIGYKIVDISKGGLNRQERYVIDEDGIIIGLVIKEFNDPLEAITELIALNNKWLRNIIIKEVNNERY
ncbi:MAG: hypothetical protein QXI16_02240 [Sulfolobaceae archaeon]